MDVLEAMATFTRVVEAGSLSAAAKQLRVSSAAVSRRVAALEAQLGTRLLARSTRRMMVTPAGLRYYATSAVCASSEMSPRRNR
jgi:DNA-binding transcriptional LysR family regulator